MRNKFINPIEIEIDELTNSIVNIISGDSFTTEVLEVTSADLKNVTKSNNWLFSWNSEPKEKDRDVFKLTIKDNSKIIQGLISISNQIDHVYIHLIESAPFNMGKNKLYKGVPGNLVAFACKRSKDNGHQGFVSFMSKTKLIEHYCATLGASHIGGHRMIIYANAADILINKYFKT